MERFYMGTKDRLIDYLSKVDTSLVSYFVSNEGSVHINVKSFSAILDVNFLEVQNILNKEMTLARIELPLMFVCSDCTAFVDYTYY